MRTRWLARAACCTSRRPAHFHRQSRTVHRATSRESSKIRAAPPWRTPRSIWSTSPRRSPATTTSDASGNFRFLSLAPGTYKITAEADGLQARRSHGHAADQPDTERADCIGGRRSRTDGDGQRASPSGQHRRDAEPADAGRRGAVVACRFPGGTTSGSWSRRLVCQAWARWAADSREAPARRDPASTTIRRKRPSTPARTVRARSPTSSSSTGSTSRAASGRVC